MPLLSSVLSQELSKFMDPESASFEAAPKNGAEFAQKFSSAINAYASSLAPPSATLSVAQAALQGSLMTVGPPPGMPFPAAITAGMTAYAVALLPGMLPAFAGVPPIPPIGPLILAAVMPLGMSGAPAATCVAALASAIDGWFRTGLAVNTVSGVTIPWA